jgi:dethiobiotin synthetase
VSGQFTQLEKAADFGRRATDSQADGCLMQESAQTVYPVRKFFSNGVKERSSLTGFIKRLGGRKGWAKGIFITGTDTGVGKTIVTGLLARYLLDQGYRVITQKWIQTGSEDGKLSSEIRQHLKLMGQPQSYIQDYLGQACPYRFRFPASAHLASRMEHQSIREDKIAASFRILSRKFDFVLVEGTGGALVPWNNKKLIIDIARKLRLGVVVVAQNKLGAINHSLLNIESLRKREMKLLGVVFNNTRNTDRVILKDNPRIVRELSGERILGVLPWVKNNDSLLYKAFFPIGRQILEKLTTDTHIVRCRFPHNTPEAGGNLTHNERKTHNA